jgi:hypothetical protein
MVVSRFGSVHLQQGGLVDRHLQQRISKKLTAGFVHQPQNDDHNQNNNKNPNPHSGFKYATDNLTGREG